MRKSKTSSSTNIRNSWPNLMTTNEVTNQHENTGLSREKPNKKK